MRGVDQIVDKLLKPVEDEQLLSSMGLFTYITELKSAFISVPRCSGKSTYIDKLANHFKSPLIIAKNRYFTGHFCRGHTIVSSLKTLRSRPTFRGRNNYYPAILADEVPTAVVKEIVNELIYYGAVDKNTIVLGLSTS
tara:strand:- start:3506 stop:3919 length:414 start_codon:yes stop_codon:yes gene_type:complete